MITMIIHNLTQSSISIIEIYLAWSYSRNVKYMKTGQMSRTKVAAVNHGAPQ